MCADAVVQQRRESAHLRLLPLRRFAEDARLLFQQGALKPPSLRTQVPESPEEGESYNDCIQKQGNVMRLQRERVLQDEIPLRQQEDRDQYRIASKRQQHEPGKANTSSDTIDCLS